MPFVEGDDGVRTRYEVAGSGPPLVLHIGFLGTLEDWSRPDAPYVPALRERYRVIALDPRGQGRSDTPHEAAAYVPERRAADVVAVLDAVGVARAHFWGYSMGGTVGYMLAARHPDRLRSLIAGGASPYFTASDPEAHPWYRAMAAGMDAFVADFEGQFGRLPPGVRERWLAGDAAALRANMRAPDRAAELTAALPGMTMPALLYAGTADDPDPVERAAGVMPNARFVPLAGLNHPQAFRRHDLVLPVVMAFLEEVEATARG